MAVATTNPAGTKEYNRFARMPRFPVKKRTSPTRLRRTPDLAPTPADPRIFIASIAIRLHVEPRSKLSASRPPRVPFVHVSLVFDAVREPSPRACAAGARDGPGLVDFSSSALPASEADAAPLHSYRPSTAAEPTFTPVFDYPSMKNGLHLGTDANVGERAFMKERG